MCLDKARISELEKELQQIQESLKRLEQEKQGSVKHGEQLQSSMKKNEDEVVRLKKESDDLKNAQKPLEEELSRAKDDLKQEITKSQVKSTISYSPFTVHVINTVHFLIGLT